MKLLVTGSAGFIGSALSIRLLDRGDKVVGIDNHNDYYDIALKEARLARHKDHPNYTHIRMNLEDREAMAKLFEDEQFDSVVNLAAQAGVRYSIENPLAYVDTNLVGFAHILEGCRHNSVGHLVYASSSSTYGLNTKQPYSTHEAVNHPVSLYAATKKANELMAHTYSHLYNIPTTGLRFFTVYGPRGRPDMAPYKFLKAIKNGDTFQKYGDGTSSRDYTYIDDIVSGIIAALDNKKNIKCEIYNLGNSSPVTLNEFISICEKVSEKTALYDQIEEQLGDVPHTYADISKAKRDLGYEPKINLVDGLKKLYLSL